MSVVEDVSRAIIQLLQTEVCPNLHVVTHPDYVEIATLPAIVISLPVFQEVRVDTSAQRRQERNEETGRYVSAPPSTIYDLRYTCDLITNTTLGEEGAFQIGERFMRFWQRHTELAVGDTSYKIQRPIATTPGAVSAEHQTQRAEFAILRVPFDAEPDAGGAIVTNMEVTYDHRDRRGPAETKSYWGND